MCGCNCLQVCAGTSMAVLTLNLRWFFCASLLSFDLQQPSMNEKPMKRVLFSCGVNVEYAVSKASPHACIPVMGFGRLLKRHTVWLRREMIVAEVQVNLISGKCLASFLVVCGLHPSFRACFMSSQRFPIIFLGHSGCFAMRFYLVTIQPSWESTAVFLHLLQTTCLLFVMLSWTCRHKAV